MFVDILFDSSIDLTKMMIEHYQKGLVSYHEFIANTLIKIQFIRQISTAINDQEKRQAAEEIMQAYQFIIKSRLSQISSAS